MSTLKVTGWKMVGAHYKNGFRYSGFTLLELSNGKTRYYPENVAIGPALEQERLEHGTDISEAKDRLDRWVKTGA